MSQVFLRRLPKGGDLLTEIIKACEEAEVKIGSLSLIGALTKGSLSYYDQRDFSYKQACEFLGSCEIVSCSGNISENKGKTFAHVHLIVSDEKGVCRGGHLTAGSCEIFAAELCIFGADASGEPVPVRAKDPATGLFLWKNR